MTLEKKIAHLLISKHQTLSIAESCTGGLLSHRLTNIPGSSAFFHFGLIVYANKAKCKLLKINEKILITYGAVSPQTARAMAKNVRKILKSDIGIAITGIAGPSGAAKNKPVGLVYIALNTQNKEICKKFNFKGTRASIKQQSSTKALNLIGNLFS